MKALTTSMPHSLTYAHLTSHTLSHTAGCVCVQGYKQQRAYIATQGPLPGTVNDLWRMIWEHNCSCIIMLCDLTEDDKVMGQKTIFIGGGGVCIKPYVNYLVS